MPLIILLIIYGNNKKMNLKKIDIIKISNNMYQVQQKEILKKAQFIFSNGLKSQQRLSKNMINKANTVLVNFYDGKCDEEIKKKELEIKQLRMQKKDMKIKIRARHKELMEHFGYIEKKVPNNLKLECWNLFHGPLNQNGNCFCCKMLIDKRNYYARYIVPLINGGQMIKENVRILCKNCNKNMNSNEHMKQYMIRVGFLK